MRHTVREATRNIKHAKEELDADSMVYFRKKAIVELIRATNNDWFEDWKDVPRSAQGVDAYNGNAFQLRDEDADA